MFDVDWAHLTCLLVIGVFLEYLHRFLRTALAKRIGQVAKTRTKFGEVAQDQLTDVQRRSLDCKLLRKLFNRTRFFRHFSSSPFQHSKTFCPAPSQVEPGASRFCDLAGRDAVGAFFGLFKGCGGRLHLCVSRFQLVKTCNIRSGNCIRFNLMILLVKTCNNRSRNCIPTHSLRFPLSKKSFAGI